MYHFSGIIGLILILTRHLASEMAHIHRSVVFWTMMQNHGNINGIFLQVGLGPGPRIKEGPNMNIRPEAQQEQKNLYYMSYLLHSNSD